MAARGCTLWKKADIPAEEVQQRLFVFKDLGATGFQMLKLCANAFSAFLYCNSIAITL